MIISGTVFQTDGKTPAPNTLIYLYHTDMYGIYGRGSEHKHGRFRGWMLTDAKGKYEFRSIRPQKSRKGQRIYSRRDVDKLLVSMAALVAQQRRAVRSRQPPHRRQHLARRPPPPPGRQRGRLRQRRDRRQRLVPGRSP